MRKLPLLALVALLFSLSPLTSVMAAGYGAAGCGLGGKLIGNNNDILAQLGATTLNNALPGSQTFAMSSGTLGCSKAFGSAQSEQKIFAENNFNNLSKEMAVGEGESLDTLAGLMGCPSDTTQAFATFTKQNYDSIFPSEQTTPSEMLDSLKNSISNDPVLGASCPKI
jgi:Protein of unknown function (DUF3015)